MKPPPFRLIRKRHDWEACLQRMQQEPRVAIDLEANSMYAYREQVCLVQITIPGQDYIVDPLAIPKLDGFGAILADAAIEKVFHAAEYDLKLLKQQFGWTLTNLFDTMWAARILGYDRFGLASLLEQFYETNLNKRYQKSNWCKRPLSAAQLSYAQLDTHYLLQLRHDLAAELAEAGRTEEADHIFAEQTYVTVTDHTFDPESFWQIHGVYDLNRQGQAIARALHIYRDEQAAKRNQPLFKIFSDKTLLQLAAEAPTHQGQLQAIHGMTRGQIRRYGTQILETIEQGKQDPPPAFPKRTKRPPEAVVNRYDRLHLWRKQRAQKRGVESDVIISKNALWSIAQENPQTIADLAQIDMVGEWRCRWYGEELLKILQEG